MRRVRLGRTGLESSALGFGCASLGSRVTAEEGLRALEAAFDAGVTWLDLAPAYGRGQAEAIAARFIRGRRDRLGICTKVGLAPPANAGGLKGRVMGAALPLARRAIGAVPALRGLARASGATANRKLPLTPELIRSSLEASLERLGTDHVDLYALHNATPEEIARAENRRALEDLIAAGKTRAVAVAGEAAVAEAAVAGASDPGAAPFGAIQLALPAPGAGAEVLGAAGAAGMGVLTHSVFGVEGAFADLERALAAPEVRAEALALAGLGESRTGEPRAALGRLLLARAFALNPSGVVLVSMFSERSRAANLALADSPPDPAAAAFLDRLARG